MSLYFEPQRAALCGVHALNMLLQAPYFSEVDLAQIGQAFDEKERALMLEAGVDSADFIRFAAEDSGNVAADGMFSIQVLQEALSVFSLHCEPLSMLPAVCADPVSQTAFLCNQDQHWFALRRLQGQWWSFNSLSAAPSPVSDLYLSLLLTQLEAERYTIYAVSGSWPSPHALRGADAQTGGRWLTPAEAAAACAAAAAAKAAGAARSAIDNALARAGAGGTLVLRQPRSVDDAGDDPDLRAALAASLGEAGDGWAQRLGGGEDDELARAIAASMEDERPRAKRHESVAGRATLAAPAAAPASASAVPTEPAEGAQGGVLLALRLPDGLRVKRRFLCSEPLSSVRAFLSSMGVAMEGHVLATGFPPAVLADERASLAELGLVSQSSLNVQKRA